jgi:2-polyprenyl-6-hydroxyphenyl methylase/3-demethylubiquinone-9 3-methyltransferase
LKIDNQLYDSYGRLWWEDDGCGAMSSIRFLVNPLRFAFFRHTAERLFGSNLHGYSFLDVGCGGGFLTEEFCRQGLNVTGIDASYNSVVTAKAHAEQGQNADPAHINYVRGLAELLPLRNASFDFIACCDVLEHVADPRTVIAEISRVLRPGGIFFYETVNRTFISWIMTIKAMQEWKGTCFVPQGVHSWDMFIRPKELTGMMAAYGLDNKEIRGLSPGMNMIANYLNLRRLAGGRIGHREFARRLKFHLSKDISNVYVGYAVRGAHVAPSTGQADGALPLALPVGAKS